MLSQSGRLLIMAVVIVGAAADVVARADEKQDGPRVGVSVPLAIPRGMTTKIVLRGWKLDLTTEVRTMAAGITAKLVNKGKATVPNGQDAKLVGDTQLEVELTIPAVFSEPEVAVAAVGPNGESRVYGVLVGGRQPIVAEKEGNDGFGQAQSIAVPQIVDSQIQADRDVDVFSVMTDAGRALVVEVIARRRGSALDSLVTVYDDGGGLLASNDDGEGADSRVRFTTKNAGKFYIVVQDAHDHGGPVHPYRLVVRESDQ